MKLRFLITMNMPARHGNQVHQVIGDYPVESLQELVEALATEEFIVVEEFYKKPNSNDYRSVGCIALNHRFVGKVKEFMSNHYVE